MLSPSRYHEIALDAEPAEIQLKLYNSYPEFRGFADNTLNTVIAEAVCVLALKASAGADQVLLLAPVASEEWVLKQIESVAIRIFRGCPERHPDRAEIMIHAYAKLFKKVKLMGRLLQLRDEPVHWVSFGFSTEDELPPWMPGRLLTL